jgi:5'-nucleotidase / UDP-sugar diphosphatase
MTRNTRKLSKVAAITLIAAALGLFLFAATGVLAAEPLKLTIFHMNDIHAHYLPYPVRGFAEPIGGLAKARTVMSEVEKANQREGKQTLMLIAGDLLMGTPFSTMFKGRLGIALLNTMGIVAMTVGNHEFDYGQDNLIQTLKPAARFPLLSANIRNDEGDSIFQRTIQETFPGSDATALIFGLTTDQTPVTTHPANVKGLVFEDPIKVAEEILKTAKPSDLVIALTHIGFEEDKKLAEACPRINVIIGGHSHTELSQPVRVNDTIICQAASYAKFLGRLDLVFSEGRVTEYQGRLILLDQDIKEDAEIASIIAEHKRQLDAKLNGIIGQTAVPLDGNCRWSPPGESTNFGSLVGYVMAQSSGSDVAVFNAGSIRKSIDTGNITSGDVYTALPFANSVVKLDLRGTDLSEILQRGADLEEGSGGRLQTYAITYGLQEGKVKIGKVAGKDFDPDRMYSVATNDFLAAGGDGYSTFKEKGRNAYPTAMPLSDILVDYIKQNSALTKELLDGLK